MNITIRKWSKDNNRLEADVSLGDDFRRRYIIPKGYTEKAAYKYAEKKALESHKKAEAAKPIPVSELTINNFYPEFQKDLVNNSPSTQDTYHRLYLKHLQPLTGKWKLAEITTKHIDDLRSTLLMTTCSKVGRKTALDKKHKHKDKGFKHNQTLSPKTVNSVLTCFMSLLSRAHRWNKISSLPHCKYVPMVHGEASKIDKEKYYDKDQEVAVVDAAYSLGIMPYVFILLGLDAGLRVSEMAGLTWDNIDFTRKVISVKYAVVVKDGVLIVKSPKMNKIRVVNMGSERLYQGLKQAFNLSVEKKGRVLQKVLLDQSATRGLWGESELSPASLKYWMGVITAAAAELNPRVKPCKNPHKLRHTCATRIAESGNVMAVKEQLGHGSVNTSLIYMHNEYGSIIKDALKDAYNPMNKGLKLVEKAVNE